MTTMKDASTVTANPRAAGLSPERLDTLDRFLQSRYIDAGKIPGALTLIYRRGEVAHFSPLGFADVGRETPVRPSWTPESTERAARPTDVRARTRANTVSSA